MSCGIKHRQQQTANACKQHLREKHMDELALVNDFILEIEGTGKSMDITRWSQFTDIKDIKEKMLKRVDEHF
jgi:hypothetical protein